MQTDPDFYLIALCCAYVLNLMLAAIATTRRDSGNGSSAFVILLLTLCVWIFGNIGESLVPDLEQKIRWANAQYVGMSALPVIWLVFVVRYTGYEHWMFKMPRLLLLWIVPVVTNVMVWTDPLHSLFRSATGIVPQWGVAVLRSTPGIWFWVHTLYSYLSLFAGSVILVTRLVYAPRLYRRQLWALLVAVLIPWTANIISITNIVPVLIDLTPLAFTLTGIIIFWHLLRFTLMDVVPAAYETVVDSVHDPIIILDEDNRIINANRAAKRSILPAAISTRNAPLFSNQHDFLASIGARVDQGGVVVSGSSDNQHYYDMGISPILRKGRPLSSSIIVLRDITNLKKTEYALRATNNRIRSDLEAASVIQESLLPRSFPQIAGVRFHWYYRPIEELAGDIFNVFRLNEHNVGLYLLDVSGHGLVAALLSIALTKLLTPLPDHFSLLKQVLDRPPGNRITPPVTVAETLNKRYPLNEETQQYFTFLYGILDTQSLVFRFVSAGNPGFVHLKPDAEAQVITQPSFPIGVTELPEYKEDALQLRPGDRLYFYSDGLCETLRTQSGFQDTRAVTRIINDLRSRSLEDSVDTLLDETTNHDNSIPPVDDVSILGFEIQG